MASQSDLLTSREVADLLRCTRETVYRLVHRHELPRPVKVGVRSYWRRRDVDDFLERRSLLPPRRRSSA